MTIRTFVKRMNRLTSCFSNRWDNHGAALALFFMHYNYCRKHSALKGHTPAMAHGLTTEVWSVREYDRNGDSMIADWILEGNLHAMVQAISWITR